MSNTETTTAAPPAAAPAKGATSEEGKRKFVRKVAPSKAPRRLLKKKLRDLERLIKNKNKDAARDLPEEAIKDTEKKMADIKKQLEAMGPEKPAQDQKPSKKALKAAAKAAKAAASESSFVIDTPAKGGAKFTELKSGLTPDGPKKLTHNHLFAVQPTPSEMRRAGRKITAFKKQHPNYEASEEDSKTLAELELDLLYIKYYPKNEEYILIYPESPITDDDQIRKQKDIREKIKEALTTGQIRKSPREKSNNKAASRKNADNQDESTTVIGKHPASNWSDDDEEDEVEKSDSVEDDKPQPKKQKSE
ncbi:hypothetical protein EDD11_001482 [Mortierella claussenii]|nr:hypothetical protein EDD11_001482 [Mortierella claussenii]